MNQDADATDVSLPAAELLVQRGAGDDLVLIDGEQRQISAEVNGLTPLVNDRRIRHPVLDKQPLLRGHRQKEFVEAHFVGRFQRSQG
jgi:hypothetical protein